MAKRKTPARGADGKFLSSGSTKSKGKGKGKGKRKSGSTTPRASRAAGGDIVLVLDGPPAKKKGKGKGKRKTSTDLFGASNKSLREQLLIAGGGAAGGLAIADGIARLEVLQPNPDKDPESMGERVKLYARETPHRFIAVIGTMLFFLAPKIVKKPKTRKQIRALGAGLAVSGAAVELKNRASEMMDKADEAPPSGDPQIEGPRRKYGRRGGRRRGGVQPRYTTPRLEAPSAKRRGRGLSGPQDVWADSSGDDGGSVWN